MTNKTHYLWGLPKESKHTEASFSPILTDSLCLRVVQMPTSRDLAIFVPIDKTDCFTPCACARGNKWSMMAQCTWCMQ